MPITHFLVTALVAIFQFVTVDLTVIQLWKTSLDKSYQLVRIGRYAGVDFECSDSPEPMTTRWTFMRPGGQELVTTFSDTLKIRMFNESHVGNYQCRVFPSSGDEIWRSFTLCMAKDERKEPTIHKSSFPTCSQMSKSIGVQVIKFNKLQKTAEASEQENDFVVTRLKKIKSVQKTETRTKTPLQCPFDEERDSSLIWMVNRMLDYKQLKNYNTDGVQSLKPTRNGRYDCLVGNSVGYVRYRFIVKAGPTDIDATAAPSNADSDEETEPSLSMKIVIGSACFVVLLAVAIMVILCLRRRRRKRDLMVVVSSLPTKSTNSNHYSVCGSSETIPEAIVLPVVRHKHNDPPDYVDCDWIYNRVSEYGTVLASPWEIQREQLTLGEEVSAVDSGRIFKGHLANYVPGSLIRVIVKTQSENPTMTMIADLVGELETMKAIGNHPNIVNLLGACTGIDSFCIVMEYARHGNLRDYLRQRLPSTGYETIVDSRNDEQKVLTDKDLVSFAEQVAKGMEYLASKGCVHRSLATVNVLIASQRTLKIADYAIATETRSTKESESSLFRWMAPETLSNQIYTVESNVWSYGILLWEIMTFADEPFPLAPSSEKLFRELQVGYRMEKPIHCSNDAYTLMTECWSNNPVERPVFSDLVRRLGDMLARLTDEHFPEELGEKYENLASHSHA